jgi:sugar phosphate permease
MNPSNNRAQGWANRVFLGSWTLYAGYYICRRDLGLPSASGSSHLALELICFGITYAVGNFVAGALADLRSAKRTALAGALISIACSVLLAWASPRFELVLELGNGFGQGFGWPSLLKLIGCHFDRDERDRTLGWWGASYILGGFLATVLGEWLATRTNSSIGYGFYPIYFISPAILLSCALYFWLRMRNIPDAHAPRSASTWRPLLKSRSIRYISAMYFLLKMTRYTLLYWLPHYLMLSFGYSAFTAARTASYFEIVGCLGPIALGYLTPRVFSGNRIRLGAALLYGLAFVCLVHPLLAASGWFGIILSISVMGILIHGADMLMSGMAVLEAVPSDYHGRAIGLVNAVGSAGETLSPLLATLFVAHFGWTILFDLFVFFALAAGVICSFGARSEPTDKPRPNRSLSPASDFPL